MPWESKRQQRWGHGKGGKKAGFSPEKIKEWDEETDFESIPEEAMSSISLNPPTIPSRFWPWSTETDTERSFPKAVIASKPFPDAAPPFGSKDEDEDDDSESESDETATTAITAEPFPGAAPPFGSKDDDPDEGTLDPEDEDDEDDADEETEASFYSWGTFALDALPDTLTDDPSESDDAVDHSEDGEARDTSTAGFAYAARLVAGQQGITSPISKLPSAPPGAAEKAKKKTKLGRGIEGDGDEGIDPMSTIDKFNWDNLPLPGMGQI